MNLNNLRVGIKSQINTAVKAGLDVDGAKEILGAELESLLKRAKVLEVVPFPNAVPDVTEEQLAAYTDIYQSMMSAWYNRSPDIFTLVAEIEELRFDEVKSKAGLLTRLTDLAETVQLNTRTHWGEMKAMFGLGDKTWVKRIHAVTEEPKESAVKDLTMINAR